MGEERRPEELAVAFLEYSFKGIDYKYDDLTSEERRLCTEDEFQALLYWMEMVKKGVA